jgi:Aldo/keto reductase family
VPQDNGVPLASNQVQYSLLYRVPERNGVAAAVKDAGATLIAYSPLCQGLLTGGVTAEPRGAGPPLHTVFGARVKPGWRCTGGWFGWRTAHGWQLRLSLGVCVGALDTPAAIAAHRQQHHTGACHL